MRRTPGSEAWQKRVRAPPTRAKLDLMQRGPSTAGTASDREGIRAEFVHAAGRHQTWTSLSTARQFEVAESCSALPTSVLKPGDIGYVTYAGATAIVRRIDLVIRQEQLVEAGSATTWVRAALSELSYDAAIEDLEIVAVTRMGAANADTDPATLARSIGERCAEFGRHRQLQGR